MSPVPTRAHWALLAVAIASWAAALALSSRPGSVELVACGVLFLGACIALAAGEIGSGRIHRGSPRALGWLLVVLTASFLPSLAVSGAWVGDSLLMLPAALGSVSSWISLPWLTYAGPQPSWREGRFTPVLLAWLGVALNLRLSN